MTASLQTITDETRNHQNTSTERDIEEAAGKGSGMEVSTDQRNREVLMDRYPVDEAELDYLLSLDRTKLFDAEFSVTSLTDLLNPKEETHTEHLKMIASIEKDFLPELPRIFQHECQGVFVVGVSSEETPELYTCSQLVEASITLMGRKGASLGDKIFSAVTGKENDTTNTDEDTVPVTQLADWVYRLSCAAYCLDHCSLSHTEISSLEKLPTEWAASMASGISRRQPTAAMSRSEFHHWIETTAPEVPHLLATVFSHILLVPSKDACYFPWVSSAHTKNSPSSSSSSSLTSFWSRPTDAMALQLSLMGHGGPWLQEPRRLYSSDENGLAFTTFSESLLTFAGPTLVLIRTTRNDVLGFYTELKWRKGPQWYTAAATDNNNDSEEPNLAPGSSCLFRLKPQWSVHNLQQKPAVDPNLPAPPPWARKKKNVFHQYLHTPVSYHSHKGTIEGLAMGGIAADTPRLHLTTSLEQCKAGVMDSTFGEGPLLADCRDDEQFFDVDSLEVWAIRSFDFAECLQAGQLHASIRESTRRHMAQVDRLQFVEDFASGVYLNRSYQHRDWSRGRADYK